MLVENPQPYVRLVVENAHPHISFWLDVADKVLKVLAVLLGGAWTLMHYLRGRTFKRRLEPGVSGELFTAQGKPYLKMAFTLKNLGLSKCGIDWPGTWGEVQLMKPAGREKWKRFELFRSHKWIESGEPVTDAVVLSVPPPETYVALQLIIRVKSQKGWWRWWPAKQIVWRASNIVASPDPVVTVEQRPAATGLRGLILGLLQGG